MKQLRLGIFTTGSYCGKLVPAIDKDDTTQDPPVASRGFSWVELKVFFSMLGKVRSRLYHPLFVRGRRGDAREARGVSRSAGAGERMPAGRQISLAEAVWCLTQLVVQSTLRTRPDLSTFSGGFLLIGRPPETPKSCHFVSAHASPSAWKSPHPAPGGPAVVGGRLKRHLLHKESRPSLGTPPHTHVVVGLLSGLSL